MYSSQHSSEHSSQYSSQSIGITCSPSESLFYSSVNQTALLLAELFTSLSYKVTLLDYKNSDTVWWSDFPRTSNVETSNLYQAKGLDWIIDIDGRIASDTRKMVAKQSIIFMRTFLQFAEMEATVYIDAAYTPRDMNGVHEIWCWDILNPVETIPSIQTMFPCPIRRVPFIWSSSVASHYSDGKSYTTFNKSWTVHVAEKNTTNSSSCILPLTAIRELVTKKHIDAVYKLYNMDHIKDNRFFKENVELNIEMSTLPIEILPKTPYYEWLTTDKQILFSHSRFTHLRIGLLNAVWMGIPVVHNSSILRDLHPALARLFYKGNDIKEMVNVFTTFTKHSSEWYKYVNGVQYTILSKYGIVAKKEEWATVCKDAFSGNLTVLEHTVLEKQSLDCITVAFEDMWPGFNYNSNFIMDALRHEQPTVTLQGVKYDINLKPNLLIFGPYTQKWKSVPESIPKVFFSAENWPEVYDLSVKLYITSSSVENEKYMRIPTWMTFVDWFSNATTLPEACEDNPIRLPVHFAMKPHPIPFRDRTKFCGFVVTNPMCQLRNDTFHKVHNYKHVNSGGALFNNIGGQLSLKYPGGGCGDISKHHFFAEHRFTISFENSQAAGYVTEKLLHSKMAGCVPLYWGDVHAGDVNASDFAPNSFINLSAITNSDTVVEVIKKLEANPIMCSAIAATPLLNQEKKEKALRSISMMSKKLFEIMGLKQDNACLNAKQDNAKQLDVHLTSIEKTYVINLDTRPDRWENLMKAEPYLSHVVTREAAVNGRQLTMTQEIYDMFNKNQFQWKKSIIGCNLSHISVWSQIAKQESGKYFLVLEDDVRFTKGWQEKWNTYVKYIPEDADLLYLGGVLPPNKPALPIVTAEYNEYWSYIKPNTLFSNTPISLFHFCAYSYILTRRGAQKLIDHVYNSDTKSFTVSDHLLGHPSVGLVKYFTNPLLSYCFQEEDPAYIQSQFNDLHRKDNFDSDLWNNTDCFSEEELKPFVNVYVHEIVEEQEIQKVEQEKQVEQEIQVTPLRVYYMPADGDTTFCLYEKTWLEDMFQQPIDFISIYTSEILNNSWYLVQRPHIDKLSVFFKALESRGMTFKAIHVSDEFLQDPIHFYDNSNCKAVVRMYLRGDVPDSPRIITIPLGYHHKYTGTSKSWKERELVWSFHGTNWFNRQEHLEKLVQYIPFSCNLQPSWNHPTATKEKHYISHMANSKFCPVMRGQNVETFRIYEALESNTLPFTFTKNEYSSWIDDRINLSSLYDWTDPQCIGKISENEGENIRETVMKRWESWKQCIRESIAKYNLL